METVRGKRVFVGLSGGVDSAVSAALLIEEGARVTGVFIKGWYPPGMPCTWAEDRRDAMRVAAHLGIPFRTLDASREYQQNVIDYLRAEYRAGRTPNPDVMCNRFVKFGAFHAYAMRAGADAIATGHYVSGAKDQRYFLWNVPPDALARTLFPLAGKEKQETRELARKFRLPVAEKPDSQGICFLGPVSVLEFLASEAPPGPGRALDLGGNEVGTHAGALAATLGERVALTDAPPGPWFVHAKNAGENELIVSHEPLPVQEERRTRVPFTSANWHAQSERVTTAQLRYRGPRYAGKISGDAFVPDASLPEWAAPGQSIVFWSDEVLVGGGIICP